MAMMSSPSINTPCSSQRITRSASGLAAGADGYIGKPFKMSALMAAVNLVLGRA